MKGLGKDLPRAVIAGILAVLPFVVLEIACNRAAPITLPDAILLFGLLGLLGMVFAAVCLSLWRDLQSGRSPSTWSSLQWLRIFMLVMTFVVWISIVIDQMPCFLGLPDCD